MKLEGKVAVITGAASGIGAACARAFSSVGAKVAVVDVDAKGSQVIADSIGGIAVECDLADAAAIEAMGSEVEQRLGSVQVLFNNAGIGSGAGMLDSPLEEWQSQWDVNLMSHVHAVRAVDVDIHVHLARVVEIHARRLRDAIRDAVRRHNGNGSV